MPLHLPSLIDMARARDAKHLNPAIPRRSTSLRRSDSPDSADRMIMEAMRRASVEDRTEASLASSKSSKRRSFPAVVKIQTFTKRAQRPVSAIVPPTWSYEAASSYDSARSSFSDVSWATRLAIPVSPRLAVDGFRVSSLRAVKSGELLSASFDRNVDLRTSDEAHRLLNARDVPAVAASPGSFQSIAAAAPAASSPSHLAAAAEALAQYIRDNVVQLPGLEGPYGRTPYCYADWTASGMPLRCIEDYIQEQVLPMYANTHSEESFSGRQMNALRIEARDMVMQACEADPAPYACLFTGSGSTAAIAKIIQILDLSLPQGPDGKARRDKLPDRHRPCVLVGPFEHHSNLLTWRESTALVIEIPLDRKTGQMCSRTLQRELNAARQRQHSLIIGSFSAASNVTGVLIDLYQVARMVHAVGGLVFFDHAAYACHRDVKMRLTGGQNPTDIEYVDAVFMSPHKFVGGPGCPGILIARRALLQRDVPSSVGGGTVLLVSQAQTIYHESIEQREEAGTPDIIGSIRAGLAFAMKKVVSTDYRDQRLRSVQERIRSIWGSERNIHVLGPPLDHDRAMIFSFLIRGLHPNFVNALLNDLFGIQSRSGCFCAHQYMTELLTSGNTKSATLDDMARIARRGRSFIPGATRLSFTWFDSDEHNEYILQAVKHIAQSGWRYLPDYYIDLETGSVQHRKHHLPLTSLMAGFRGMSPEPTAVDCSQSRRSSMQLPQSASLASRDAGGLALKVEALLPRLNHVQSRIHQDVLEMSFVEAKERQQFVSEQDAQFRFFALPGEIIQLMRQAHGEVIGEQGQWLALCAQLDSSCLYRSTKPLGDSTAVPPAFENEEPQRARLRRANHQAPGKEPARRHSLLESIAGLKIGRGKAALSVSRVTAA